MTATRKHTMGANIDHIAHRPARATQWHALRLSLILSDAMALALAFALAFWARFNLDLPLLRTEVVGNSDFYRQAVVFIIPLWLGLFALNGLYRESNLLGGTREYALVFNAVTSGVIAIVVITFFSQEFVLARAWLLMAWALGFLVVCVERFFLRRVVYYLRAHGWFLAPTLIVGANEEAVSLAEQLGRWRASGLQVLGLVTPSGVGVGQRVGSFDVVGNLSDLPTLVARYNILEVVVATSAVHRWQLVDVFRRLADIPDVRLRLSGGMYEVITTGLTVKELAFVSLIEVQPVRLSGADWVLKNLLDYAVAIAVVVLFWPLYLALALAIKLSSPGPVLHRRRVLGLGSRPFDAFKFRTMRIDGDQILAEHPELLAQLAKDHKLKHDPRITRVGHILRKLSLDELPQVLNVLRGEMSIVGPRMISPEEHAKYGRWDMNLLTVKPGLTGLWQISGRSDLSYDERVRLDMNYIRNWTIWEDLRILLQTIPVVVFGRGAY